MNFLLVSRLSKRIFLVHEIGRFLSTVYFQAKPKYSRTKIIPTFLETGVCTSYSELSSINNICSFLKNLKGLQSTFSIQNSLLSGLTTHLG